MTLLLRLSIRTSEKDNAEATVRYWRRLSSSVDTTKRHWSSARWTTAFLPPDSVRHLMSSARGAGGKRLQERPQRASLVLYASRTKEAPKLVMLDPRSETHCGDWRTFDGSAAAYVDNWTDTSSANRACTGRGPGHCRVIRLASSSPNTSQTHPSRLYLKAATSRSAETSAKRHCPSHCRLAEAGRSRRRSLPCRLLWISTAASRALIKDQRLHQAPSLRLLTGPLRTLLR